MSMPDLTSLLKQSQITDHEEALRAANAALKASKNDLEAQHVKVVALLKLDRFDDAVRAIETGGEKLKASAKLEYAYALYKSGRRQDAADISQSTTSRGLQHVEAQALYGLEEFVRAADLYKSLSKKAYDDNVADLRVNTLAVDAQLGWSNQGQHLERATTSREDFDAHETLYNQACNSIARGEIGAAEVLLKRAKHLCDSLQDLSDEEKATELLPITVQHIFVLTRLGRQEEAQKLAENIPAEAVPNDFTRHLAKVNKQAAMATLNPFLLERQLSASLDSFWPDQPFKFQQDVLSRNQFALDLATMKFQGTAAATQPQDAAQPSISPDAINRSVVNAAAHAKNQTGKAGLKHILPLLEKRPCDVGLVLTIVQLYVLIDNANTAIEILHKFMNRIEQTDLGARIELRYSPGLVGTLVSLYTSQGRRESAISELNKAASHWRRRAKDLTPGTIHLLKAAGSALLQSPDVEHRESAKEIFQVLHSKDASDNYAVAGLQAAASEPIADDSALTSLEKLIAGIDAEGLEQAGIAQRVTATPLTVSRKRPALPESAKATPKKMRKSKLPTNYDPAKASDPERWLPLRDRSTYKPKGKKGKARQAMFSQGAVINDSEASRPATPGGEVVKAKVVQPAGGINSSKKKKKKAKK